jgi:hypothetical protein
LYRYGCDNQNQIKNYELPPDKEEHIQATSIVVGDWIGPLTITAVYNLPTRHHVLTETFKNFFETVGHRFIARGDYNTKHIYWGARITTPEGTELMGAMK